MMEFFRGNGLFAKESFINNDWLDIQYASDMFYLGFISNFSF